MSSDPPRKPWDLTVVSFVFLALAIVELVMAVTIPRPGTGANIGLPFALFAVLASGAAASVGTWSRRQPPESGARLTARAIMVPALLLAGLVLLFVGGGILEELR